MKLEHRTKWVEALRSGEYLQGMGFLKVKRADGKCYHCCLDVLCEVLKSELSYSEHADLTERDNEAVLIYRIENGTGALSAFLRSRVGMTKLTHDALINLNDYQGKTFNEIADWIEANIEADTEEEAGTSEAV